MINNRVYVAVRGIREDKLQAFELGGMLHDFYGKVEVKNGLTRTYLLGDAKILINDPNSDREALIRLSGHEEAIGKTMQSLEERFGIKFKLEAKST